MDDITMRKVLTEFDKHVAEIRRMIEEARSPLFASMTTVETPSGERLRMDFSCDWDKPA